MERLLAGGGKQSASGHSWSPIAAGEFVLGYPNERGVDLLARMPHRAAQILRNGTFAAFRRIEQHVELFEQTLSREASRWNMCPSELMNKIVGRKPNGESLTKPGEVTDFSYADDPDGTRCPLGAHVRRANPRLTGEHRVIRRGMPYGQKPDSGERGGSASSDARGIYFVAFNASIEDQFEFIQSTWLNKPVGALPQSRDPLSSGGSDAGRMLVEGDAEAGRDPIVLELPKFVTCRGGQYYFLPGIRALRRIADLPDAQAHHRPILTLEQQ
jgi:Dyp-type peroxidase family